MAAIAQLVPSKSLVTAAAAEPWEGRKQNGGHESGRVTSRSSGWGHGDGEGEVAGGCALKGTAHPDGRGLRITGRGKL